LSIVIPNLQLLALGKRLLTDIDDPAYRYQSVLVGSSIGAQVRHLLDHYRCFLDNWLGGMVDYRARRRDEELQRCRRRAYDEHQAIASRLVELRDGSRPLRVVGDGSGSAAASSVARELDFLVSHTVHHHALIAVICRELAAPVPAEFGVAAATVRHRASL